MRCIARPSWQELGEFHVDVRPRRNHVVVVPVGELDVATAATLEAQLRELRGSGFEHIVLDLRELTFMDSTGVALILAEDRFAHATGREFSVIDGRPPIQRVLDACGLREHIRFTSAARLGAGSPLPVSALAGAA